MLGSPGGSAQPPNTIQVLQQDLIRVYLWFLRTFEGLINWTFNITQRGAQRRRNFFLVISGLSWTVIAFVSHDVRWALWYVQPFAVLTDLATAYFAPDVSRHVLVAAVAFWLAFRQAAVYLDDIFELADVKVAERFIRQAAFASQYDWIMIKDGDISPESKNSPIYRIGGPGMVLIHLENAALFEKADGKPNIIGPRGGSPILESFERLRAVLDLRNQVVEMTVRGRSRDGIHITAKDVRLIFSVMRDPEQGNGQHEFSQPYSYLDDALLNLVYRKYNGPWTVAMRKLIRENLRTFMAQHNLSAFLASVSPFERLEGDANGAQAPASEAGDTRIEPRPAETQRDFVTRDEITNLFYDFTHGFSNEAERLGVELQWIGVGTWITPSEIIPQQHQKAWQVSLENQILGSDLALGQVREEKRDAELLRLIREVPLTTFGRLQAEGLESPEIMKELLLTYREKLRNAWEVYQNSERSAPPELEASLKHLARLTARWLA